MLQMFTKTGHLVKMLSKQCGSGVHGYNVTKIPIQDEWIFVCVCLLGAFAKAACSTYCMTQIYLNTSER